MSQLIDFYTYEAMENAIVFSASSEATNHPAEHAILPLEPNFSWEANEASVQHTLVIDLGEIKTCDGFSFIHQEIEQTTPTNQSVDMECEFSFDAVHWDTTTLAERDVTSDLENPDIRIKIRNFESGGNPIALNARYWRFTAVGPAAPNFYAPADMRVSMLWLHRRRQIDTGASFPVDDTLIYPANSISLPFGKIFRTGHSATPHTTMSRTFMVTTNEYETLLQVMRDCNGAYRPFTFIESDNVRRLCKFASDEIKEDLLDIGLYQISFQFVALPILGKDKYH